MIIAGASREDPRAINLDTVVGTVNTSKAGLTPASVAITGPTLLLLIGGQSIGGNFNGPATITIGNPNVQMLHPLDGTLWQAAEPLLGNDGTLSSPASYLARDLVTNGVFPRVIIMACAIGASLASQQAVGGKYQNHIPNMISRAKAYGWLDDPRVKQAMIWAQGITEAILPLDTVPASQWQTAFNSMRSRAEAEGWTGPTWVEKQTEWAAHRQTQRRSVRPRPPW